MRILKLMLILALSGAAHAQPSAALERFVVTKAPALLLRNVRVIDGTGTDARENRDVYILDGRIAGLGPTGSLDVQPGTEEHNLYGATLLPGYVMVHEHLMYPANSATYFYVTNQPILFPRLYLAAGVTTARTAGGVNVSQDINIKAEIDAGRLAGPSLDVTSPHMVGGLGAGQAFPYGVIGLSNIRTPDDARQFVDYWATRGVTSFKSLTHVSRAVLRAGLEAAHERGMKFTSHLCSVTYREAAEMGVDNIEHGFFEMTDFVAGKEQDVCPDARSDLANLSPDDAEVSELLDLLISRGVAVTSTLPVFVRNHPILGALPESALNLLNAPSQAAYLRRREQALAVGEARLAEVDARLRGAMALTRAFHDRGGLLLVGTDPTGMGGTIAGHANFEAIELLVEAGFTPLEAIKVATVNGAAYLERDDIGAIALGKRADLVVIDGKPDWNIKDVRKVRWVVKEGVVYDSRQLFDSARGGIGGPGV